MANRFIALDVALQLAQALGRILPLIKRHDTDLARQLKRAGTSVPSCLAEGTNRAGRDRLHLYRIAGGSAAEVHTQLTLAVAWGDLEPDAAAPALQLADRTVALTWRLTHPRK